MSKSGSIYLRTNFEISPNSQEWLFIADFETFHEGNLYSVSIFGGGLLKVNMPMAGAGHRCVELHHHADNKSVVYTADAFIDQKIELFHASAGHPLVYAVTE